MKKNIIIVLAISVPILLGIYLYRKNKTTKQRQRRKNSAATDTGGIATDNARQQIYDLQQGQILRDKFIAGGILKESDLPN
jgi:hypothetical protein